jgi:hypothetical protein
MKIWRKLSIFLLVALYAIILPVFFFSWFVTSHRYFEIHVIPLAVGFYAIIASLVWAIYGFFNKWQLGLARIAVVFFLIVIVKMFRIWPYCGTPWAAHTARQHIALVHPGMTATEVWKTLGLESYDFHTRYSGSGDPRAWPVHYMLWPGNDLFCRWNNTTNPAILVKIHFKSSPYDFSDEPRFP